MAKSWTSLRVQAETAARLRKIAEEFLSRDDRPPGLEGTDHHTTPISTDAVIRFLVSAYYDHRKRARRSRQKRARSRPEASSRPPLTPIAS
jgi:hypothetical protein